MRDYGKVSPQFWIGGTGKLLRGNTEAQVMALYLMTSPHASMTGVFHCPVIYMAHETGLSSEGASKGLASLIDVGFCEYDEASESVFVINMAAYQIDDSLKPDDKRVLGLRKEVEKMLPTRFQKRFVEVYGERFHLSKPGRNTSPLEAPYKPLPSQEQEQEQEQEQNNSTAIAVLVGSEAADAGANSGDNGNRLPNCPHQRIVELYGEILPEQPQPRSWEGQRAKHLQARWRWLLTAKKRNGQPYATTEAEALDFFRRMFTHIRSSDFLMRQWTSWDLGWLVKAENFEKIIAGNYENREAA